MNCIRDFSSSWSGSLNLTCLSFKRAIYVLLFWKIVSIVVGTLRRKLGFEKKFGYEVKFFVHGNLGPCFSFLFNFLSKLCDGPLFVFPFLPIVPCEVAMFYNIYNHHFNTLKDTKPILQQHCQWIHPCCSYGNKYNMLVSKLIYYDEKSIFLGAQQVKIIGYLLSRLEVNVLIHVKQKNNLLD
jgi:hypothetical protein